MLRHKSFVMVSVPPFTEFHHDTTNGTILSSGGIGKCSLVETYFHRKKYPKKLSISMDLFSSITCSISRLGSGLSSGSYAQFKECS